VKTIAGWAGWPKRHPPTGENESNEAGNPYHAKENHRNQSLAVGNAYRCAIGFSHQDTAQRPAVERPALFSGPLQRSFAAMP